MCWQRFQTKKVVLTKGKWFYQLHIFKYSRQFFSLFLKNPVKKKKGLQLDLNSRSACYEADALTIGPQSFYTTSGKNC
jgi:hypothetical protein